MRSRGFTLVEMLIVITLIVLLAGMLVPVLSKAREKARRVNCAGNMKCKGLALLMYSGDNGGFLPVLTARGTNHFEPLNIQDVSDDGKSYACPSASQSLTMARNSNYRYRGSGYKDDDEFATSITIAYDRSGNHPDNQWMNALFLDGHAEGAKPDGNKQPNGWNVTH
jgi:prepilin-type N-terminal cleavage/methylation domain-containing protein/prepilin-type processing-associated H-X9-DG protein